MAGRAVRRGKSRSRCRVHWIIRLLPRSQVASGVSTIGRLDRQRVVVIKVAGGADDAGMSVGQEESGGAVIENAGGPCGDCVTRSALSSRGRESSGDVVGNIPPQCCSALECSLMAAVAVGRIQSEIIIHVAGSAGRRSRRSVRPGQSKASRSVIERRRIPGNSRVAGGAVGRSEGCSSGGMQRRIGLLPGGQVATGVPAIVWLDRQRVVVVEMAGGASHAGMSVGQRESCCAVIEDTSGPGGDGVARGALSSRRRESSSDVVGDIPAQRCSALECRLVTAVAVGRIQREVIIYVAGSAGRRRW